MRARLDIYRQQQEESNLSRLSGDGENSMMKTILSVIVVFATAIGLSYAYADEFRMPFNPDDLIEHRVNVAFSPTEDGGVDVLVTHESLFHYDNIVSMPDRFYDQIVDENGGVYSSEPIEIRQVYEDMIFPAVEPEPEPSKLTPEIIARIEEKTAEREKVIEKALRCVLGIEGSSLFTEYRELAVLKQMVYFKSLPLSYQERQLILWTEECRTWSESYLSNFRQYDDIFKDQQRNPAYSKVLDETDSPSTDPLTEEDFAEEIADAERFMCSEKGKQLGLCVQEFEGINRGGYTEGAECLTQMGRVMCPLIDYNKLITNAISAEDNYSNIENLVCDKYLSQYQHLVQRIQEGDETAELPHWLAHCQVNKQ